MDNILKDLDVTDMSFPFHPQTALSNCANLEHSEFGGIDSSADRGNTSCEPCSAVLNGTWDEVAGVCRDIPTRKFRCGSYDHLPGGQETEWESGCCEERDCEADTCGGLNENRGDCCGLWSTSACACPSNYKDCDGNVKTAIDPGTGLSVPTRRPFVLDLGIDGGSGGCCVTGDNIIGLVGETFNAGSFAPQMQSRIIITEV